MSEEKRVEDPNPEEVARPLENDDSQAIDFEKVEAELQSIKKIAEGLLSKALIMMRGLATLSKNRAVETFQDTYRTSVNPEKILQTLREVILQKIDDAEKVYKELGKFIQKSEAGMKIMNFEECPMLSEVWSGDVYDLRELKGLGEFKKDLSSQLTQLTEPLVIKEAYEKMVERQEIVPPKKQNSKLSRSEGLPLDLRSRDPSRKRSAEPPKKQ